LNKGINTNTNRRNFTTLSEPHFIYTMLLLSSGFVGLASTLLVYLIKRYKSVRTTCISIYLIILFMIVGLQYYQFYGTNESILTYTLFTSSALFFLLGPILYFYIRILLNQQKINLKKDWKHFIPLLICFICIFPWLISSHTEKIFFIKAVMNNRLLVLSNPDNLLLIEPSILMLLIPIHLLTYLIVCLYKIIHEDAVNPGIIHTNATVNTLIYLFLLFQCYLAIMYSIGTFSLYYHINLSPTLVTNFPPENFNVTQYGVASLIILVFITSVLVYFTDSKTKNQDNTSNSSVLR